MSDTPETDAAYLAALRDLSRPMDESLSDFARKLERERDEARRVANYCMSEASKECTLAQRANKERDELSAEVKRLKEKSQSDFENREREFREMNRVLNGLRGLWKHLPNIENKYDERLAYHLDELIERLKADAELYSGWSKWKDGIWRISHPDSGPSVEWIAEDLDSVMKGAE